MRKVGALAAPLSRYAPIRKCTPLITIAAIGVAGFLGLKGSPIFAGGIDDARAGYRAGVGSDCATAITWLTRAIDSNELSSRSLATAYISRGVCYRRQGYFLHAIDDYTKALQVEPRNVLALTNRGLALAKWERYDEAIDDLTRAIAINPNRWKTFLIRGNAHFDKRSYAEAIADYDHALKLVPQLRAAKINRRDAYQRMQQPDRPCSCKVTLNPNTRAEGSIQSQSGGSPFTGE